MPNHTNTPLPTIGYNETTVILLLLLITAVGQSAVDIYLPSMPSMQSALSTTKDNIQLTLSVYTIGFGFSQLFYGPLSDRYGRRNLLFFGMALSALAAIGCVFATSVSGLIASRLIQGIGAGAASVLTRAILRDCFTGIRMSQVAGYMSIAWSLVPITAPVIGSYIQTYFGWRANFVFLLVFSMFVLILTIRWMPDTNHDKRIHTLHPLAVIKNYLTVLTYMPSVRFSIGPMITFACTISYVTASPFLFQVDLGYSPVVFGWLSLLASMSYLIGNIVNSRLLPRYGKMHMIRCGILFNMAGTFSMALFALLGYLNVYVLIIPACMMLFSGGFLFANCMSSAMIPFINIAGTAAAIIGCIQMLGGSIASGIVSQLPFKTQLPLSILLVILSCIMAVTVFGLEEPVHDQQ